MFGKIDDPYALLARGGGGNFGTTFSQPQKMENTPLPYTFMYKHK